MNGTQQVSHMSTVEADIDMWTTPVPCAVKLVSTAWSKLNDSSPQDAPTTGVITTGTPVREEVEVEVEVDHV